MAKKKSISQTDKKAVSRINDAITNLEKNKFTLYFFIVDTKNIPNSNIEYIYEMAKTLYDDGFNVKMLYQLENEYTEAELYKLTKANEEIDSSRMFIGVKDWLGEEYSSLPHMNIAVEEWTISPSDFLFIPDALSGLMFETYKHKVPCKRFVILQNYSNVTEFIPLGVEWKNYGIYDVIARTEKQADLIKKTFPYLNVRVLPPCVSDMFRKPILPKKLTINIVTKDPADINKIIKPFYWKYPIYSFISFRELRNLPRDKFVENLQEGIVTVWVDRDTSFGYVPLEAMRCDNIVVGKVPDDIPEWMQDEEGIINNGLWVFNINDIPDVIAQAIGLWMNNKVPDELIEEMEKTNKLYSCEQWVSNVINVFDDIVEEQVKMFNEVKNNIIKGDSEQ